MSVIDSITENSGWKGLLQTTQLRIDPDARLVFWKQPSMVTRRNFQTEP